MAFDYGRKRTEAEAAAAVDAYVQPRDCFIWYIDNKWGWQSFSATRDTPCAHYVAHQLGLTSSTGARCKSGYLVRVNDVVARLGTPIDLADVRVGDVWARLRGTARAGGGNEPTSHCGIVSKVDRSHENDLIVLIKHCSSGQRAVAENDWATWFKRGGKFYRLPAREQTAAVDANRQRLSRGFAFQTPFRPIGGRAV